MVLKEILDRLGFDVRAVQALRGRVLTPGMIALSYVGSAMIAEAAKRFGALTDTGPEWTHRPRG